MGQSVSVIPNVAASAVDASKNATKEKPKCKACCACPETKKARDACIMDHGEEKCGELIEKHKQCMRDMGFNI
ncbi:cytochrome c oxidase copper chaperone [Anopheles maculipalpis]|uniref:cytochrome c oxidase copper chaperone n=1 Tax=Anopheles maculipalpis TaxID=1496333 RepID=UPI0021590A36|nr:cytochrome c oxidase copper chaperone [Anopheles maculipalpis]